MTVQSSEIPHAFGTHLIHAGSEPNKDTNAVIPSISLSTTYQQSSVGVHKGFEYSRSLNPNRLALETLLATLELPRSYQRSVSVESPPNAFAFSSGSATTAAIVQSIAGHDGHIISVGDVYGGTFRYFTKVASVSSRVQTTFLDMTVTQNGESEHSERVTKMIEDEITPNTKLIWIESPTNPTLKLVDIGLVSSIAQKHGIVVAVDNTFLSPYFQRPLELGADIAVHSITKYINGHSDVVMGAAITKNDDVAQKLRFSQNSTGSVPSSFDAWLAHRGAKTLQLRMRQHGTSALKLAKYLVSKIDSGLVEKVFYPGLAVPGNEHVQKLAWKQLSPDAKQWILYGDEDVKQGQGATTTNGANGHSSSTHVPESILENGFPCGGMLSFRLASKDPNAADRFLSALSVFTLAESLGGVESLAELPSRMTHASLTPEARAASGIDDQLIRLSVGIEDFSDLARDIDSGLKASIAKN